MRDVIASIEQEYRRYRKMGLAVLEQLGDDQLCHKVSPESNSIATIVWHVAGNLASRFTDFLTTDGEKPWRQREDEFAERTASREELVGKWKAGFAVVLGELGALSDAELQEVITIRGVEHSVSEALHRSLAHTSYHVGQMTYLGKMLAGSDWDYLTIPPGGTAEYNRNPTYEKG